MPKVTLTKRPTYRKFKSHTASIEATREARRGIETPIPDNYRWPGEDRLLTWFSQRDWVVMDLRKESWAFPYAQITASIEVNKRVYYVCLRANARIFIYPLDLAFHPLWEYQAGLWDIRDKLPAKVVENLDELCLYLHKDSDLESMFVPLGDPGPITDWL